jgi:hypothetical protein
VTYEAVEPLLHAQHPQQPLARILVAVGAGEEPPPGDAAPVDTAIGMLLAQLAAQTPAPRLGLKAGAQPAV